MSLCNQRMFRTDSNIMVLHMIVPPHLECTRECSGFGQTLPVPITAVRCTELARPADWVYRIGGVNSC